MSALRMGTIGIPYVYDVLAVLLEYGADPDDDHIVQADPKTGLRETWLAIALQYGLPPLKP